MSNFSESKIKHAYSVLIISGIIFFFGTLSNNVLAQCTSSNAGNSSPQSVDNSGDSQTWSQNAKSYVKLTGVVNGTTYRISSSNSNDYITVRTSNNGGTVIKYGKTDLDFTATATSTVYIITNTNSSCGTNGSSRTITLTPVPNITGVTSSACVGGTVSVTGAALSGVTSVSVNGKNAPDFTINSSTSISVTIPSGATSGKVSVTSPGGTVQSSSSVTINTSPTDNTGSDKSICTGTSATLGASNTSGRTYKWSPATGLSSTSVSNPAASPTVTTTYTLTETITATGCSASNSVVVTVNPLPSNKTVSALASTLCSGNSTSIKVTSSSYGYSYQLRNNDDNSSIGNDVNGNGGSIYLPTGNLSSTTTFNVLATNNTTGCSLQMSNTPTVTVGSGISNITPTGATTICAGNSANISIPGSQSGVSYQLRDNSDNTSVGSPVTGNGGTIVLPTGSLSSTTTFNVLASASSCSLQMSGTVKITVNPSPDDNAGVNRAICSGTAVSIGRSSTSGRTYSWAPATGLSNPTVSNPVASPTVTTTYTLTEIITATGCSATNSVIVTAGTNPTVSITPNYCSGGGNVQLTSTSYTSYQWSTGSANQSITVDRAGTYSVTAYDANGCSGSASYSLSLELVVNGDFENDNTGFTSSYTYTSSGYNSNNPSSGLFPEGKYAVGTNANYYHSNFFGKDHTSGSGKFMIVNGATSSTPVTVWQENITIVPNTVYYFSAYAMSVNTVNPFAKLKFSVDDVQVGTTAILASGPSSNSGPFNWVRFYATWNSGNKTSAVLSIVDLQTAAGGNDFALDDISCSTLSTVPLDATPSYDITCTGDTLKVYSNITGGKLPLTYLWSGPNSFSATTENINILNATTSLNGNYYITVTDAHGCSSAASASNVTVKPAPQDKTITAAASTLCTGNSTNIKVVSSVNGVTYQLRNNTGNSNIGSPVSGNGATINLPTGTLPSGTTTFNVLATTTSSGCSAQMEDTPSVTISSLPVISTQPVDRAICGGNSTTFSVASGNSDLTYQWKERQGVSGSFVNITDGTAGNSVVYSGATTGTLTISNIPTGISDWYYYCIIGNSCGSSTSNTVSLSSTDPGRWNGTSSINWNDAANWCNGVPDKTTDVTIPSGTPYQPTINSSAECHNLTISSGATVTIASGGTLDLYGDLTINGTFNSNNGLFQLKGNLMQNIPSVTAKDVVVDNNQGVTINGDMTVTNTITLNNGKIYTGDYEVNLTSKSSSAISGYTKEKYIVGKLRRAINVTGTYDLPVGSPVNYQLAVIDVNVLLGVDNVVAKFTASRMNMPAIAIIKNGKSVKDIVDCGYWTIDANHQPIAGTYSVSLFPLGATNMKNSDDLIILKKPSGSAVTNLTAPGTYLPSLLNTLGDRGGKMGGLTSFSDFGVGVGQGSILPIKLTYFSAKKSDYNDDVLLQWNTAAEINNDHFELEVATEMTVDGKLDFRKFGELPGAGTSSIPHDYDYTDDEPGKSGMRYYRLKQIDYDGTFTYSDIQPLSFGDKVELSELYPNPVTNILHFTIESSAEKDITISIYNLTGQEVYRNPVHLNEGSNMMTFDMTQIPRGYYIFNVAGGSDIKIKEKFEKF